MWGKIVLAVVVLWNYIVVQNFTVYMHGDITVF